MGFLGIVALVGLYDTLRLAWPVMILAPILGAVGLTLMTISHVIPQATLAAPRTLRSDRLGDQRCWQLPGLGVVVPLYAVAILTTCARYGGGSDGSARRELPMALDERWP